MHPKFHALRFDLAAPDSFSKILAGLPPQDLVVHAAAKLPQGSAEFCEDDQAYFRLNFDATRTILEACSQGSVGRFVLLSSMGGLDKSKKSLAEDAPFLPGNAYHCSKAAAELLAAQFNVQGRVPATVLRISAPYGYTGRSLGVVPRFIAQARTKAPLTLWGGGQRQQVFTFVEDVGLACALAAEAGASGTFHIAGEETVTMLALAEAVIEAFPGTGSRIVFSGAPDPLEGIEVGISTVKARQAFGYVAQHNLAQGLAHIAAMGPERMIFAAEVS
jgi:nucleoside-diphosphate-sugar epimerase